MRKNDMLLRGQAEIAKDARRRLTDLETKEYATSALTEEQIQDYVGAMVTGNTEMGIAVTYDDTGGKLNYDAQTAGDTRYAPLGTGVSNGDSHDHSGGDGAQINHTALSNVGSNTHAQVDTHIAATTAHGVTGNIVGTGGAQTLASKTLTTPTIADFTNAQHDHGDADDGGTLNSDNITEGSTHLFFTPAEETKLAGIEAAADITDAVNVAAAGAVMTSGAQSIAGAKELTDDLTRREVGDVAFMQVISDGLQAVHQVISYRDSATGGFMGGYGARGSEGTPAVSQQNDRVFSFSAFGWSAAANAFVACAQINFIIDGTPDSGGDTTDMPGRITLQTSPDGSSSPQIGLTVDKEQLVTMAKYLVWAGQKRVSTQFDKVASTTLATITGLSVTVEADKAYYFEATLHITADATGGHKVAIAGTATATAIIYQVESLDNGTDALVIASRQTALAGAVGQAGATEVRCLIRGEITVNAAGTLLVQFAQNASSGTSSVLVGSTFIVSQIT